MYQLTPPPRFLSRFSLFIMAYFISANALFSQDDCDTPYTQADYQMALSQLISVREVGESVSATVTAEVPVRFYIVLDDNGNGSLVNYDQAYMQDVLNFLNTEYSTHPDIDFNFVQCGEVNIIHNTSFYNGTKDIKNYAHVSQAVNVYVVNSPGSSNATFPWSTVGPNNVIYLKDYNIGSNTLAHEMGHHFGLLHTYGAEIAYHNPVMTFHDDYPYSSTFPRELVIRELQPSNSPLMFKTPNHGGYPYDGPLYTKAGDFVGQTPAGCKPTNQSAFPGCSFTPCEYSGTYVDYNGMPIDDPSNILAKNMMSASGCRSEFVDEQLERAYGIFELFRKFQYETEDCGNLDDRVEFEGTDHGQDRVAITFDQLGQIAKTLTTPNGDFDGIITNTIGSTAYATSEVIKLGSNSDFSFTQDEWRDGVTTQDLVLISKHILGVGPFLNGYQMVAADVNNSGGVTTFDIVTIRKLILHITNNFPAFDQPWRFIPEFVTLNNPTHFDGGSDDNPFLFDLTGSQTYQLKPDKQGFDAVKLGDVNGSNSESLLGEDPSELGEPIYLDIVKSGENGVETYDFRVEDFEDIVAYQFDIEFTDEYLDYSESLSRDLQGVNPDYFGLTQIDQGIIHTLWYDEANGGSASLEDLEEIFRLVFNVNTNNNSTAVHIANGVGFRSTDKTAKPLRNFAYTSDGTIRPIIEREYRNSSIASFSADPNPFSGSFSLQIEAIDNTEAQVTLLNTTGQTIYSAKQKLQKGTNSLKINGLGNLPAGVYFVQITAGGVVATKKVVKQG